MMVREATQVEKFCGPDLAPGSQVVLRPWHLHRHMWLWDNPDGFDPERWQNENGKYCQRAAFIPFVLARGSAPGRVLRCLKGYCCSRGSVRLMSLRP